MKIVYETRIVKRINGGCAVYILKHSIDGTWNGEIDDNNTVRFKTKFDEYVEYDERILKPLLIIPHFESNEIVESMVDGLKTLGYVAEVDNAERITAEAKAKEREESLNYFKSLNKNLIENIYLKYDKIPRENNEEID